MARLILTGDVNLMNVTDAATPFRRVAAEFRAADMVFCQSGMLPLRAAQSPFVPQ